MTLRPSPGGCQRSAGIASRAMTGNTLAVPQMKTWLDSRFGMLPKACTQATFSLIHQTPTRTIQKINA